MKRIFNAIFLLLTAVLMVPSWGAAETNQFSNSSYKEAKKADSFVRFDMSSTKLGLLTTSFTGFVKNFTVDGEVQKDVVTKASIEFLVQDMDTDVDGRNEKMWNYCFDMKTHPKIRMTLLKPIEINAGLVEVPATLSIRGADHAVTLNAKVERTSSGDLIFDFNGDLSLKALDIPDPSIVVASVKDNIKIKSRFVVKGK